MNYQSFIIQKINRQEINESHYNLRKISDEARKRLKKEIKENGLVMPLVINKQTGNTLVSGHQRLSILDELNKTQDYEIDVAIVDMDLEQEIKLNIALNNTNLMGEYDAEKLSEIISEYEAIDPIKDLGFDKLDFDYMNINLGKEEEKVKINSDELRNIKHEYRKKQKAQMEESGEFIYGEQNDYILTIVFNTNKDKQEFNRKIGIKFDEKYVKASKIYDIIKEVYRF